MTYLFNNFLLWLQNGMENKYVKHRLEFENKHYDDADRIVWVHELCECPEKARFETEFPSLAVTVRYKPAVMLGELIHVALEEWGLEYTPQIYHKTVKVDGEEVIVAGMPDYVSYALDTVVDFKYSAHIGQEPLQHHEVQVALYKWLCDVKHGELWYLTHDSFKSFPVEYEVDIDDVTDMILSEQIPRWPEWECKYTLIREN